jgi:site-specific recombinase XerD
MHCCQLPLTVDVGEALQDYILNGRQNVDEPEVFLRHRWPHRAFADAKEFHPNAGKFADDYLFYVEQRRQYFSFSDSLARKIVRQYGEDAKTVCDEIASIVHPHMLRHSRAMHLYQKGNDLVLIQQWLGHSSMETTLVYAYADTEHKRKALEASIDPASPLAKRRNAERFTISDDETVKKLYGLV